MNQAIAFVWGIVVGMFIATLILLQLMLYTHHRVDMLRVQMEAVTQRGEELKTLCLLED